MAKRTVEKVIEYTPDFSETVNAMDVWIAENGLNRTAIKMAPEGHGSLNIIIRYTFKTAKDATKFKLFWG